MSFRVSTAWARKKRAAVLRVCRSRSLYRYYGVDPQGEVDAFEREFSAFLRVRHVLAVTSGTSALHTALAALKVGPGQEVIVPAYMWVSVIAAVVNLGAIPVLAEIDDTFCLDPDSVRRNLTPRTAGIDAGAYERRSGRRGAALLDWRASRACFSLKIALSVPAAR